MNANPAPLRPRLISFSLCPYVQRSVITLLEKDVAYDIDYIELDAPPEWFLRISPLRKVPALRVGDTALFESAVINEYLDEIHPPSLHPPAPLRRAHNRAWIEVGSELIGDQFRLYTAATQETFEQALAAIESKFSRLEEQLGAGPFFNGETAALVDFAYAPLFQRFALLEAWQPLHLTEEFPRIAAWQEALVRRPSTAASVLDDFAERFRAYIRDHGAYAAGQFARA